VGALYTVGSAMFWGGFRALGLDVRPIDHHNIPSSGPAVIASNHIGYLDFALVVLAPPKPRREVRFLARAEFFETPVIGGLMHQLGQIPVDVHGDPMQAAEVARKELERGELVGMHPEGTISPSFVPRRAKSGAVRLADSAGAPIVPVAIWGSQRILTKDRPARPTRGAVVTVRYGEPFVPSGRTGMARTKELMDRIASLLELSQASYPQRPGPPPDDWWLPAHLGGSAPTVEEAEARIEAQNLERRERRQSQG
jgi:1-acyl-sn-glycerol-3-phosphate acyltransferase